MTNYENTPHTHYSLILNTSLPPLGGIGGLLAWFLLCIAAGAILRIVLLCHPLTVTSSLSVGQWLGIFSLGAVNDLCVSMLLAVPLICFWLSSGHWKFGRPQCFIFLALLIIGWLWVMFGATVLWEFNKPLTRIIRWVMLAWIFSFALRAFVPAIRKWWMRTWTAILLFVYLGLFTMNVVGEWFFWNEFGVRYNFIAVDYLIYTNEVVGNIMQSYSMGWIIAGVVTVTLLLEILLFRKVILASSEFYHKGWRMKVSLATLLGCIVALIILPITEKAQHSDNTWYNGLQANGIYSFLKAFTSNSLDYKDFYVVCSPDQMPTVPTLSPDSTAQCLPDTLRPNIILVTLESMSADYMAHFGDERHLTPFLDSLWHKSIAFNRMFSAGNRTVRGLEAIILSRPPSPGESIIKRECNTGYPSVVDILKDKGYNLTFYYGGNSYFDNMESFFTGLGYDIRDRKTLDDADISCQTVWGVCDGDVYARALCDIDSAALSGTPIFAHILTTSNHRPYIYPDGCISIPPSEQSRSGAVMYSDFALGQFIKGASEKPWFANTIFIICSDHCASSAGSTELPLENYHIPALIYSPDLLEARQIDKVTSQIDIFPTLYALLGWDADSALYGEDVLSDSYRPRAFIATYQDLGYIRADTLTVLSPGRNYRQFVLSPTPANPFATLPVKTPDLRHVYEAAALYQSADKP